MRIIALLIVNCFMAFAQVRSHIVDVIPNVANDTTGCIRLWSLDIPRTYVALCGSSTVATSFELKMPSADGTSGQAIVTNGSGQLSFADVNGYWDRTGTILSPINAGDTIAGAYADFAPNGGTGNYTRVRKLDIVDTNGGNVSWDVQTTINGSANSYMFIRDNAGANVMAFYRIYLGATANYSTLDMSLYPASSAARDLGSSSFYWKDVYSVNLRALSSLYVHNIQGVSSSDVLFNVNAIPSADVTYNLGSSSYKWNNIYTNNLTVTGTCTGCGSGGGLFTDGGATTYLTSTVDNLSIGGTSTSYKLGVVGVIGAENADFAPSGGIGNYTRIRKLDLVDAAGGTNFWDVQANATASTSNFIVRDNGGTEILKMNRIFAGSTENRMYVNMNLVPYTTATWSLGSSSVKWSNAYITSDVFTNNLRADNSVYAFSYHPVSGVNYALYSLHVLPGTGSTWDIGGSGGSQWRNGYFSGTVYVGGLSLSGDLLPSTTDSYNLGSSSFKWNFIHLKGGITVNGSGGVTASGSSCTIHTIVGGIITSATCI